jgi:hypothetical protein
MSGLNIIAARLSPGAISESSSTHLPPSEASQSAKPVAFPPGRSSRVTMPPAKRTSVAGSPEAVRRVTVDQLRSSNLVTPGARGFLILSQVLLRPER